MSDLRTYHKNGTNSQVRLLCPEYGEFVYLPRENYTRHHIVRRGLPSLVVELTLGSSSTLEGIRGLSQVHGLACLIATSGRVAHHSSPGRGDVAG
jgi:hypothetical protein